MLQKRMTIRVSPELHRKFARISYDQTKSLNTLAVEALESYAEQQQALSGHLPLQALSNLLSPAADAMSIDEDELLEQARAVRRRIWQERYEETVQAVKT